MITYKAVCNNGCMCYEIYKDGEFIRSCDEGELSEALREARENDSGV